MNTNLQSNGTSYSAITIEQRNALIRRGDALRAEAFAQALSAAIRPFAGRGRKRAEPARPVVDVHGTAAADSKALLSRGESWVGHDGRNAA